MTRRPSPPTDVRASLDRLRALRDAAILPCSSEDLEGRPGLEAKEEPSTPDSSSGSLFASVGETVAGASPHPAVARLLLDSLQPMGVTAADLNAAESAQGSTTLHAIQNRTGGVSQLKTLDKLHRLAQLRREGSRMVSLIP